MCVCVCVCRVVFIQKMSGTFVSFLFFPETIKQKVGPFKSSVFLVFQAREIIMRVLTKTPYLAR